MPNRSPDHDPLTGRDDRPSPQGRAARAPDPRGRRADGARLLTAVVVTLGTGGLAGGAVTWLLRFTALATGGRPDDGTTGTFLAVTTFVVALLPGAVATALGRRRTGRALLAAGAVGVAVLLAAAHEWDRLAGLAPAALGAIVPLWAAVLGVVAGAAVATAWLTGAAVDDSFPE